MCGLLQICRSCTLLSILAAFLWGEKERGKVKIKKVDNVAPFS